MQSRNTGWLTAAVLLMLVPGTSRAEEFFFFDNYCVSSSFQVCASVRVFTGPGNTLRMQIWNLEGFFGDQHTITSLALRHAGSSWGGTVEAFSASYVTGAGSTDITSYWEPSSPADPGFGGIHIELWSSAAATDGIVGCTDPLGGGMHWSTCTSFPGAPYVEFTFQLSEEFSLDDLVLRWQSTQLEDGSTAICDTGGGYDAVYGACTVVPEPLTMTLLATGLFGLGGAGALRRKRKGLDVANG